MNESRIFNFALTILLVLLTIEGSYANQEWDTGVILCDFKENNWSILNDDTKALQIISVFKTENPDFIRSQISCLLSLTTISEITKLTQDILANRENYRKMWNDESAEDFSSVKSFSELMIKGIVSSKVLIPQTVSANIYSSTDLKLLILEIINSQILSKMTLAERVNILRSFNIIKVAESSDEGLIQCYKKLIFEANKLNKEDVKK